MRSYIVEATKYGKEWKEISNGTEFLDDNKLYKLQFHAKGLIEAIRVKYAFKKNKRFTFTRELD